jgi:hypothetical protein
MFQAKISIIIVIGKEVTPYYRPRPDSKTVGGFAFCADLLSDVNTSSSNEVCQAKNTIC